MSYASSDRGVTFCGHRSPDCLGSSSGKSGALYSVELVDSFHGFPYFLGIAWALIYAVEEERGVGKGILVI